MPDLSPAQMLFMQMQGQQMGQARPRIFGLPFEIPDWLKGSGAGDPTGGAGPGGSYGRSDPFPFGKIGRPGFKENPYSGSDPGAADRIKQQQLQMLRHILRGKTTSYAGTEETGYAPHRIDYSQIENIPDWVMQWASRHPVRAERWRQQGGLSPLWPNQVAEQR